MTNDKSFSRVWLVATGDTDWCDELMIDKLERSDGSFKADGADLELRVMTGFD